MSFFQFVSAVGFGAILVKLMDILWLQRVIRDKERSTWLRERRMSVYAELSKELISFGLHQKGLGNPFKSFASVAPALLLIEDDALIDRVDKFIVRTDEMYRLMDNQADQEKCEAIYFELSSEARNIIKALRDDLVESSERASRTIGNFAQWARNLTKGFIRRKEERG